MSIPSFSKQPAEVLPVNFTFADWLASHGASYQSHVATADAGINVDSSSHLAGVVQVVLSGGSDGTKYKVTVKMTTTTGLVREADCYMKVKEL